MVFLYIYTLPVHRFFCDEFWSNFMPSCFNHSFQSRPWSDYPSNTLYLPNSTVVPPRNISGISSPFGYQYNAKPNRSLRLLDNHYKFALFPLITRCYRGTTKHTAEMAINQVLNFQFSQIDDKLKCIELLPKTTTLFHTPNPFFSSSDPRTFFNKLGNWNFTS